MSMGWVSQFVSRLSRTQVYGLNQTKIMFVGYQLFKRFVFEITLISPIVYASLFAVGLPLLIRTYSEVLSCIHAIAVLHRLIWGTQESRIPNSRSTPAWSVSTSQRWDHTLEGNCTSNVVMWFIGSFQWQQLTYSFVFIPLFLFMIFFCSFQINELVEPKILWETNPSGKRYRLAGKQVDYHAHVFSYWTKSKCNWTNN